VRVYRVCKQHGLRVVEATAAHGPEAVLCPRGHVERSWNIADEAGNIVGAGNTRGDGVLLNGYLESKTAMAAANKLIEKDPPRHPCSRGHVGQWQKSSGNFHCGECRRNRRLVKQCVIDKQLTRLKKELAELEA
jgi:hypothetical protein